MGVERQSDREGESKLEDQYRHPKVWQSDPGGLQQDDTKNVEHAEIQSHHQAEPLGNRQQSDAENAESIARSPTSAVTEVEIADCDYSKGQQ